MMWCYISTLINYLSVESDRVEWVRIMERNRLILSRMKDHLWLLRSGRSWFYYPCLSWNVTDLMWTKSRADFLTSVRYYPYTDRNISIFRATQAKKINFSRPSSIANIKGSNASSAAASNVASSIVKYAILAIVCAVASKKLSWIVTLVSKYKLVKVD